MSQTALIPNLQTACRREWCALRDGRHRWGTTSAVVGRYGVVVRTVAIYPPGSSTRERRWLRAWRSAPMFSVVLFWMGLAGFSTVLPIGAAFAATLGLIAVLFVVLGFRARRIRRGVVELATELPPGSVDEQLLARRAAVNRLAATMNTAETQLAQGRIDELEFQRRWHLAHDEAMRRIGID